ncbi:MAG TPA: hypothetical protein EYP34_13920 [Chromatiaceae bacterium]|nr:hypothetical protein [Chromatiaceae bacterium]
MNFFDKMTFRLAVSAVTGSVLALAVQAVEIPARGPIPFAAYDQNDDGSISEAEFSATRAERMAAKAAAGMPMRGAADQPAFTAFDTNGDGQLSPEELAEGQQKMQQMRRSMGKGAGRGPGMGRGRRGGANNMPAFADFDLNGDGGISEDEFLQAQSKRISERSQAGYPMRNIGNIAVFGEIDSNKDGIISAEEFSAHQIQHRQQMKRK